MNTIAHLIPLATLLSFLTGYAIPYVSALVSKTNGWWTGFVTLALSTISGFLSEWAAAGDKFDWKAAALTSIVTAAIAWGSHSKWLRGTVIEAKLLQFPAPYLQGNNKAA